MKFRLVMLLALMAWPLEAVGAEERPVAPELEKYRATGEVQHCVNRGRIRRTDVLNDYTILFHMKGNRVYKNELPYRCFNLGFYESFSYSLTTSLLCNVDIITVFRSGLSMGVSCGLGDFEELEEIAPDNIDAAGVGEASEPETGAQ